MEAQKVSRAALGAAACAALGGLLPLALSVDSARCLAWAALWAMPAGVLVARGQRLGLREAALALPPIVVLLVRDYPRPFGALGVLLGLAACGVALGRATAARSRWRWAGLALLAGAVLAGLPAGGGLAARAPWSPGVAARLLDASPVVLAAEAAGFDWLRHPTVYDPAGADAIGPALRVPWGFLAGWVLLVVGCALAWVADRLRGVRNE